MRKTIIDQNALKEFTEKNTWHYKMSNSRGLDSYNNYSGGMDKSDWIVVPVGRSRDSEIMDESNFETALEMLGGESKHVAVERFGHWGCGWFELILVNPKSKRAVRKAFEIKQILEHYPLLDDSDYSERENEYQSDFAENHKEELAEALVKHFGLKVSKQLTEIAYQLNMACQSYYGNDSCINVYNCRIPNKSDIERVKTCMREISYQFEKNKTFKALESALSKVA